MKIKIKHIVTDMGGVLVDLHWEESAKKVLGKDFNFDELVEIWIKGKSTSDYETGKQKDFSKFITQFIAEFDISIPHEEVAMCFMAIAGAPKKGFSKIFESLKKKEFIISVLSNTNPAHIQFLKGRYNLFEYFDNHFLSYEIGYLKPQKEAFQYVIKKLKALPEEILFFDDAKLNVETAKELGIYAHQVTSPQEIYDIAITYYEKRR